MRMRSIPCFSAMVCITWYAASRWSSNMACHVALVIPLDSWSAPTIMVFRSCCSSVVTLTSPETAATMVTMTVIESISFRARRCGIIPIQTWKYSNWWQALPAVCIDYLACQVDPDSLLAQAREVVAEAAPRCLHAVMLPGDVAGFEDGVIQDRKSVV